ncbi:MAG: FHA domain-containing protein [Gammaproteobacteria bacterium]|nr:FHA domain-containing protein [Gammaproteobacteria bacterium]
MSQVSLLFKDRILSIHHLDQYNDFIIGHAPDCHIHIDSLAVSSHHAKILYDDHTYTIEGLENESEIRVNNKKIEASTHLSDGDHISLGKHTLIFTFDERNENHEFREPKPAPTLAKTHMTGWIQYLNGRKMGKTLQIKKNMTNINDEKADNVALISVRSDGFYISYLKGQHTPKINNVSIGEKSTKLETNSRISLGSQEILFYTD